MPKRMPALGQTVGDRALGFEHGTLLIANDFSNMALNCKFRLGDGTDRGGSDERPSLLSRDFDSGSGHAKWGQ